MLVEPINVSGKSMASPARAGPPTAKGLAPGDKQVKEPDPSRLAEMAASVQKSLNIMHNVDLRFSVHEASGRIMVTVTDESSGKVIREIPPLEILQLAAKLDEMVGMIFDQKG